MKDPIKDAFIKVKEDITNLQSQLNEITRTLGQIKRTLPQTDRQTNQQTDPTNIQTDPTNIQTDVALKAVKALNLPVSTGNHGVPTDRQTNQQTDRQTEKFVQEDSISKIGKVAEIISSLDELKRDLRKKFKQLTPQEMLVFSTIYQLEDQHIDVDYALLAQKTNLSESSIRDYTLKIIKKGIPLVKVKENNKKITLSIPSDLRRMASLDTIHNLRNI